MSGTGPDEPDDQGRPVPDGWQRIAALTPARVALGRAGASLSTRHQLALMLAHSRARDAVDAPFEAEALAAAIGDRFGPPLIVHSAAADRQHYLLSPDLGRRLDPADAGRLAPLGADLVFVLTDGLSPIAVQRHAPPLLEAIAPLIADLSVAPPVIARQGRVALADEIGERLGARIAISLIGERPGLSAPDSLGIYLTYGPRRWTTDEARNCISNVRPAGLPSAEAAVALAALIRAALAGGCSGIALQAAPAALPVGTGEE